MIGKVIYELLRLRMWERIPKLPRGMLSARYEQIGREDRRVIARLGARDPRGVEVVLKRTKAADVNELVSRLDHFTPRRRVMRRLNKMIDRLTYGTRSHPHGRALMIDRRAARRSNDAEILRRVRAAAEMFNPKESR